MSEDATEKNKARTARVLVCDCGRTMKIDATALGRALGQDKPLDVHTALCRAEIGAFRDALEGGTPLLVACTQEAPLFAEIAAEAGKAEGVGFTNIRERAGWSAAGEAAALAKMAALIAEAGFRGTPARLTTFESEGACIVYGAGQAALDVAMALAGRLTVTLLLGQVDDLVPPAVTSLPVVRGRINRASGGLGGFTLTVDGYAPLSPSSKDAPRFEAGRDGVSLSSDLVFDMSGGSPLFTGAERRDGYFRVDPGHPAVIARAMFEITDMVGTFEKPLYVHFDAGICAHARSGQVGCSKCLDACPTGAITPDSDPDSDHVLIDPLICGGCGMCSALCPTGAVSYAYPDRRDLIMRVRVLLDAYAKAGGEHPVLLFHDPVLFLHDPVLFLHDKGFGMERIAAMARFGRGLPANVLPVALHSPSQIGHDIMISALVSGAEQMVVLASPERTGELAPLESEAAFTGAILDALGYAGQRLHVLAEADPDAIEARLWELEPLEAISAAPFAALGGKREIAGMALDRLHQAAPAPVDVIALPEGAPYGRIRIDTEGCTLCLACVGCCPAGALSDSSERPQVSFTEGACVQCGLCAKTCPEGVIRLEPRYNFTSAALTPLVLHEEAPFACIRCGKPFGTEAMVTRVLDQLGGKHPMFRSSAQATLIQMCDDCRIIAMVEQGGHPMSGAERPRIRTTDDYVEAERKARETGKKPEDFLD